MNTCKTLIAKLKDFLPWTTFTQIVDWCGGDSRVRMLSCGELYWSTAFGQTPVVVEILFGHGGHVHRIRIFRMGLHDRDFKSPLWSDSDESDKSLHCRGRGAGYPAPPRTDPGVRY